MQHFERIVEQDYIGLNDNLPPETLPPGYFSKADNVFVSDNKITKVPGSTLAGASIASQLFNGLGSFENFSSNNKYLIACLNGASNASLYSYNGTSWSVISGQTTVNNAPMWFETATNKVFGVNGTDTLDWDGTTLTKNRASWPTSKYLAWFHNYLFAAGDPNNQSRLYWSNLGDPTTFVSGTNFVDINPGDGDKIMSLGRIQDELIVLKRNTIWSITGFSGSTFSTTTIATQNTNNRIIGYGCVAPFSVVSTGNDVYFMSYLGKTPVIRSVRKTQFANTLGGGVISHDIDGTMNTITTGSIANTVGQFDGRYIYWAIPINSSTTNNKIIALDTYGIRRVRGKTVYPWITMTGKNPSYFALSTVSGTAKVYFSDVGTSGNVFFIDSTVNGDNLANIKMDAITRSFMPDPARKQKWKYLYFRFDTGTTTITINANVDEQTVFTQQEAVSTVSPSPGLGPTGTFTLGTSTLGGATRAHHRTSLLMLIGKNMRIEYTENSTKAVTIYDQEIYHKPRGLRNN